MVVRYAVYCNDLSVRTSHVDGTHAFLNGANVFCYVPGRQWEPHAVEVVAPDGWRVSTALDGGPSAFTARDFDELADSPIEMGTHRLVRFEALGKAHELAVWGRGSADLDRLAADAKRIVEAAAALMGGLPYERFLFVVHLSTSGAAGWSTSAPRRSRPAGPASSRGGPTRRRSGSSRTSSSTSGT